MRLEKRLATHPGTGVRFLPPLKEDVGLSLSGNTEGLYRD
jgi:hypothetical protein